MCSDLLQVILSFFPELVPHETVVKELVADTVRYDTELGVRGGRFYAGSFAQALFVTVKVSVYLLSIQMCTYCGPIRHLSTHTYM